MTVRLGSRLRTARRQRFVGRRAELELFERALAQEVSDFAVLHVYGPGGVGKTTLLHEFARLAQELKRPLISLDGHNLEPSPAGFTLALHRTLNLAPVEPVSTALAATPDLVLFVDTYELLTPLDSWLREVFLPELPERALVVIAGRHAPAASWRTDTGWGPLTRVIALRNLQPDECYAYLEACQVREEVMPHIIDMTFGYPLALSLAVDILSQSRQTGSLTFKHAPDMMAELLTRFVADVPDPVLRQALEVCAHALTADEGLLAHCLGAEHASHAFAWLRSLSFIEQGPRGLFPHDLAREVLEADLRWRNLSRFRELHHQVRSYIIQECATTTGSSQQAAILGLLFLHRNNPIMQPFYAWQSFGQVYNDSLSPVDMTVVEEMVRRHQGDAALAVTRHWLTRQPENFVLFRGAGGRIAGFAHLVDMARLSPEDTAVDPAMQAASEHLAATAPLRPGDVVLYFRNWLADDEGQHSSTIFSMAALFSLRHVFSTPQLAYTFVAQTEQAYYHSMFEYIRWPLAPEAGFTLGGQSYGVFVHDWRTERIFIWLDLMEPREIMDDTAAPSPTTQIDEPVVLSQPAFADAVRLALKDLRRPDLLVENPLLLSRLVRERAGEQSPVACLQSLLHEAAATLTATPKDQKLHRTLWHTYFEPAPTQEAAAELLDLPFSTFRYRLGKAVDRVVAWLWQQDVYGTD